MYGSVCVCKCVLFAEETSFRACRLAEAGRPLLQLMVKYPNNVSGVAGAGRQCVTHGVQYSLRHVVDKLGLFACVRVCARTRYANTYTHSHSRVQSICACACACSSFRFSSVHWRWRCTGDEHAVITRMRLSFARVPDRVQHLRIIAEVLGYETGCGGGSAGAGPLHMC